MRIATENRVWIVLCVGIAAGLLTREITLDRAEAFPPPLPDTGNMNLASRLAALEATVVEQASEISALKDQIDVLIDFEEEQDGRVAALETKLENVYVDGDDVIFEGVNVVVQSGSGATDGAVNGTGNLVVGYDEGLVSDKTGSHNLVVGRFHTYTSFGGFVAGQNNRVTGDYSSVSGGANNEASGLFSSVSGGQVNVASGISSSVCGGSLNIASARDSSVSGGLDNEASGLRSSVTGGDKNVASGDRSSVSAGFQNTASGVAASVSGGNANEASGGGGRVSVEAKGTWPAALIRASAGEMDVAQPVFSTGWRECCSKTTSRTILSACWQMFALRNS